MTETNGKHHATRQVRVRLPIDVVEKIEARVGKPGQFRTVSGYIRDIVVLQVRRNHHKKRG